MTTVNGHNATAGCYIEGSWGQYGTDRLADICDQFGIELNDPDRPGHWRDLAERADEDGDDHSYWEYHHDQGDTLLDTLNNATEGGHWEWVDGELFLTATGTCLHCERRIVLTEDGWIDPEADGDDEIWRETCDAHDTFTAEHEPEEETDG
jgi:hypothetical protein